MPISFKSVMESRPDERDGPNKPGAYQPYDRTEMYNMSIATFTCVSCCLVRRSVTDLEKTRRADPT